MKKVLFLYLKAFSFTGGIEKFNCSFLKALHELSIEGHISAGAFSMYDNTVDEKYFSKNRFKGFGGSRLYLVCSAIYCALKYDVLILGHINLAIVGLLVKKIKPSIQLVLVAHGIEVWDSKTRFKQQLLQKADIILAVSSFTKAKILEQNPLIRESYIQIFNNTIDPYFALPTKFNKPNYLMQRYGIVSNEQVLLTVTRLSSTEKYKGYDNTIAVIKSINQQTTKKVHYLICGKYDAAEFERVKRLIEQHDASTFVQLAGFIKDEELIDHYLLADVFVMPSKKEGFGIVFIEAMACGRKVIAGNKDGSVDALQNGELGKLIDPDDKEALLEAIEASLEESTIHPFLLQQRILDTFGFNRYKARLKQYLGV
jgi:phosphatidylinositol alpha-1,6-mannosyltransferase